MSNSSRNIDWEKMREDLNDLHCRLQQKPPHEKLEYPLSFGGILNAYREGDILFADAVQKLEEISRRAIPAPAEPTEPAEHPAFGTRCYVCQETIVGGEFAWDKHFQEKHSDHPLPSVVFQEELDAGIHK